MWLNIVLNSAASCVYRLFSYGLSSLLMVSVFVPLHKKLSVSSSSRYAPIYLTGTVLLGEVWGHQMTVASGMRNFPENERLSYWRMSRRDHSHLYAERYSYPPALRIVRQQADGVRTVILAMLSILRGIVHRREVLAHFLRGWTRSCHRTCLRNGDHD